MGRCSAQETVFYFQKLFSGPSSLPFAKKVGAKGRKFKFLTLRICKREKEKKRNSTRWPDPKIRIKIRETKDKNQKFSLSKRNSKTFFFWTIRMLQEIDNSRKSWQTNIYRSWMDVFRIWEPCNQVSQEMRQKKKGVREEKEKKMGKLLLLSPIENSISPCQIDRRFGDIGRDIFPLFKKWDTPRFDTSKTWNFLHFRI